MIKWILAKLIFKNRRTGFGLKDGVDPMPLARELLDACKGCPQARDHIKSAMRAIFEKQMEAHDDEAAD